MTDYVVVWEAFKKSEQFRKWTEPSTLGKVDEARTYLENRILAAFEYGWNAHLGSVQQKPAHEREPPHCPSCSCGVAK